MLVAIVFGIWKLNEFAVFINTVCMCVCVFVCVYSKLDHENIVKLEAVTLTSDPTSIILVSCHMTVM